MTKNADRLDNLQALRFVAAGLVLLTHTTFYVQSRIAPDFGFFYQGAAGVSLFFVISGVVIYLSSTRLPLDASGAADFFQRRVIRIFPLYWVVTTLKVAVVLLAPAISRNQAGFSYVVGSYLLLPVKNAMGHMEPIHGVGWSLVHEMFFYYVFAAAMLFRRSPFIVCSLVIGALSVVGMFTTPQNAVGMVCLNEQNLLFVAGMVLAHLHTRGFRLPAVVAGVIFVAGLLLMLTDAGRSFWTPYLKRFDIGAVLIILGAISMPSPKGRLFRGMVSLGDSSYSLYLFHPILAPALCVGLWKLGVKSLPLVVAITWVSCLVAGHLIYLHIETRLTGWAKGIFKRKPVPAPSV